MIGNRYSLFGAAVLAAVIFFAALHDNSYAIAPEPGPPCCDFPELNECLGGEFGVQACSGGNCLGAPPCTLIENAVCLPSGDQESSCVSREAVPAFNQWGLIALAAVLGVVAVIVYTQRRLRA